MSSLYEKILIGGRLSAVETNYKPTWRTFGWSVDRMGGSEINYCIDHKQVFFYF